MIWWVIGAICWVTGVVVLILFLRGVARLNRNFTDLETRILGSAEAVKALRYEGMKANRRTSYSESRNDNEKSGKEIRP